MGSVISNQGFDWAAEQSKWDKYFAELPLLQEDACTSRFNNEFVDAVAALLPHGGRTLEAGCGAAWQSLALARRGDFQTSLLDFSPKALEYARCTFEAANLSAEFIEGNLSDPSQPEFDLVFNAGVLEHYSFDDQVKLVRGMRARSRRYVLVLVPNRRCYWYWVWRQLRSARDSWPWGKEVPVDSLARVFEEAGLQLLGERYFAAAWTESFIMESLENASRTNEELLTVHRSPIVPLAEKAYLVATLGSVVRESDVPLGWSNSGWPDTDAESQLTAALCDALALKQRRNEQDTVSAAQVDDSRTERERLEMEKRRLFHTLDAVSTQIAELQAEKNRLAAGMLALEQEIAKYRENESIYRGRSDVLTQLLHEREERHNSENDRLLDLSVRVRDQETAMNGLQDQLTEVRKCRNDLEDRSAAERRGFEVDLNTVRRQLELAGEQLTSLKQQNNDLNFKLASAATTVQSAGSRIAQLEMEAADAERATAEVRSVAETFRADLDAQRAATTRLQKQLEALQANSVAALTQFDAALSKLLITVRSQRAWQVMLMIRKAYTLWVRDGWHGKLSALWVPLQGVFKSRDSLERYDIHFPSVWDFIPDSVARNEESKEDSQGLHGVPARYDIIVLPIFDFEFRFQRPQQIAAEFARLGHRVYWVSPSRFKESTSLDSLPETVPLRDHICEVRLPGPARNIYADTLTTEQGDALAQSVLALFRANNVAEAIILIQFPFWRQIGLNLRQRLGVRVIYDCIDDWSNWTAEPRISTFALNEEQNLATEADLVVATSAELQSRLEVRRGQQVLRLRNGADFPFFRNSSSGALLAHIPHPIVGYYGAIADWVDVDLISKTACSRPEYSFVIIGEVHNVDISSLRKLKNVHLLGEKNYRLIPSYLADFDACILPFMLNTLTRAVDPVKVYEYLSQGKPVVATRLAEICDHGEVIYLADRETFVAQLDLALTSDTKDKQLKRIAYAEQNAWTDRVRALSAAVETTFPLISILVVAYKSREYLDPLLDSIRRNTAYPNYEIIVVDNCSGDGTAEFLEEQARRFERLRVINLDANKGFAAGNNLAAENARGDFFVLLNADTIVTWGWLERLMRPLRTDASIAVTAPVTNFSGNETRIETSYRTLDEMQLFARALAEREFGQVLELPMVPLLCAMVSRKVWVEAGELDECFGLGMFEDDDFAIRVRRLGYRIVVVEDCFIHHFGNGSFAKLGSEESLALFERNKAYIEKKWAQPWQPHKMRTGVRPPTEAERPSPRRFCQRPRSGEPVVSRLRLVSLHPECATFGCSVNLQPDGSSALVAICDGASPGTVIKFGENILQTAYGSANLLSAVLPSDFNRFPAVIPVSLMNDFGPSNTLTFRIE